MSKYVIEGEMLRPGDAKVETIGIDAAKAAFVSMIIEGAKFVTLVEQTFNSVDGEWHDREIGRFSSFTA